MAKHLVTFLAAAALAGCGSKSPPPTTTSEPMHEPMGSNMAMPTPTPTPEAKPVETTEPAKPEPATADNDKEKADLFAAEKAAYEKAKPAFDKYCAKCHTASGKKSSKVKLGHVDMTTYPFGGMHAKAIGNQIRLVLAIDGSKATMPDDKPGSVKGADLALIKAWTEAWQAAGKAGVHPADPADKDD